MLQAGGDGGGYCVLGWECRSELHYIHTIAHVLMIVNTFGGQNWPKIRAKFIPQPIDKLYNVCYTLVIVSN